MPTRTFLRDLYNLWYYKGTILSTPSGTTDLKGNPQAAPVGPEHPLPVGLYVKRNNRWVPWNGYAEAKPPPDTLAPVLNNFEYSLNQAQFIVSLQDVETDPWTWTIYDDSYNPLLTGTGDANTSSASFALPAEYQNRNYYSVRVSDQLGNASGFMTFYGPTSPIPYIVSTQYVAAQNGGNESIVITVDKKFYAYGLMVTNAYTGQYLFNTDALGDTTTCTVNIPAGQNIIAINIYVRDRRGITFSSSSLDLSQVRPQGPGIVSASYDVDTETTNVTLDPSTTTEQRRVVLRNNGYGQIAFDQVIATGPTFAINQRLENYNHSITVYTADQTGNTVATLSDIPYDARPTFKFSGTEVEVSTNGNYYETKEFQLAAIPVVFQAIGQHNVNNLSVELMKKDSNGNFSTALTITLPAAYDKATSTLQTFDAGTYKFRLSQPTGYTIVNIKVLGYAMPNLQAGQVAEVPVPPNGYLNFRPFGPSIHVALTPTVNITLRDVIPQQDKNGDSAKFVPGIYDVGTGQFSALPATLNAGQTYRVGGQAILGGNVWAYRHFSGMSAPSYPDLTVGLTDYDANDASNQSPNFTFIVDLL